VNASNWGDLPMLWLLALVPVLVVAFAFDGQRRRRVLEKIGHLPMIRRMTASTSPARRRWKAMLTVAAVAMLVTAVARPQMQGKGRLTENRGLDLVVALDFSKSMLARDVYPSRLDRAKAELGRLIDTLKGDRVGLVAFAGETLSYPLTVDYEAAKLFWRDLGPDDMPVGGTDLGRAIDAGRDLLKHAREAELKRRPTGRRPGQVILLLTDGEDTEGKGVEAARAAAREGIKIFTLGIGSNDRPFVQTFDEDGKPNGMLQDPDGRPVRVGLDEAALRQMAAVSGGDYVAVDPQRFGVERVQQAIANLERTEEEARFEREPDDVGRFLLVPAFLVLLLGALVRERRRVTAEVAEAQPKAAEAQRGSGNRAANATPTARTVASSRPTTGEVRTQGKAA
jgi:Ca-activated chloride channel family protein